MAELIDSGYYSASDFTGLEALRGCPRAGVRPGGHRPADKDEPRWIQDETRFREALAKQGYDAEILFSQGHPPRKRPTSKT